jgi:hypothetical protein
MVKTDCFNFPQVSLHDSKARCPMIREPWGILPGDGPIDTLSLVLLYFSYYGGERYEWRIGGTGE